METYQQIQFFVCILLCWLLVIKVSTRFAAKFVFKEPCPTFWTGWIQIQGQECVIQSKVLL